MFSKKAAKNFKIFTVNLTFTEYVLKCQINSEDFVTFVAFIENMNFTTIKSN